MIEIIMQSDYVKYLEDNNADVEGANEEEIKKLKAKIKKHGDQKLEN